MTTNEPWEAAWANDNPSNARELAKPARTIPPAAVVRIEREKLAYKYGYLAAVAQQAKPRCLGCLAIVEAHGLRCPDCHKAEVTQQEAAVREAKSAAWEEGYERGYDDNDKTDCGRADVVKSVNPYADPARESDTEET